MTAALGLLALALPAAGAAQEHPGKPIYDRWCAECHGVEGRGDGPAAAWMLPRPRDFTEARYQIRSTPSGALPTDADIHYVLEHGMPGTAMPSWPRLSRGDRDQVVAYLKTLSRFFASDQAPEPLDLGRAPGGGAEAIAEGGELYQQLECWKCHGVAGRGDGESAPTQTDDRDLPIRPADLTQNWRFNGGGTVEDIYARLRTGLDGTPMPTFDDLIGAGVITNEQLWRIAHYVRSLSPERAPVAREVVRASLVAALPATLDDAAWQDAPSFYIPLVGQIIALPRWFAPSVNAVWVQALHDGQDLALRLSWSDPSRSPDPAWEPWRTSVVEAMEPHEGPPVAGDLPDAFAVQFPSRGVSGRDLPYFLFGDARSPVYLWHWRSDTGVTEQLGRGLGSLESLPADGAPVQAQHAFADGQWQLMLRRRVAAADTARRISFPAATAVPIAFFAWDGSNGEGGTRGSISSWYFIHLEQPVTAGVYVTPVLAAALTALLAFLLVTRAQKQHAAAGHAAGSKREDPRILTPHSGV